MIRKIRYNTFETNSSSTHAICISKKNKINSLPQSSCEYYECQLIIKVGNYNRRFEILKTPEEKISYLYTSLLCLYEDEDDKIDEALNKLKNILELYNIKYKIVVPDKGEWYFVGSFGFLEPFIEDIFSNESKFLTFIFGDSFIVVGNDEEPEYDHYMHKDPMSDEIADSLGGYWNYSGEFKDKFNDYEIFETYN